VLSLYRMFTRFIHTVSYPVTRFRAARGEQIWRDRLGLDTAGIEAELWLHAASVGEVKVLSCLYRYLKRRRPHLRACVTVTTTPGHQTARKLFGEEAAVRYLPADTTPIVARVLAAVRPRCLVIAETEIWPILITQAARRRIPVILVNGRMSDTGFRRYRMVAPFLRGLLPCYDRFFFKSEQDAERYRYFGLPESACRVTGDMKFDAPLWPRSAGRRAAVRATVGARDHDWLIVAGSTRPGEEALLLRGIPDLRGAGNGLRLVLAPRHVERAEEVAQACRDAAVPCAVYGSADLSAPVVIVDRMGLLMDLYMAADLAFVGGTLVDVGGHNILEPVWAGTPVLYGPSLANVGDAAEYIEAHNYGARVGGPEEFAAAVRDIRAGRRTFATKTEHDYDRSPTAAAGEYILAKLSDD